MLLGDLRQRKKIVNAGVVDQDVDSPELGYRGVDKLFGFSRFADIRTHCFGFSSGGLDFGNYRLGPWPLLE